MFLQTHSTDILSYYINKPHYHRRISVLLVSLSCQLFTKLYVVCVAQALYIIRHHTYICITESTRFSHKFNISRFVSLPRKTHNKYIVERIWFKYKHHLVATMLRQRVWREKKASSLLASPVLLLSELPSHRTHMLSFYICFSHTLVPSLTRRLCSVIFQTASITRTISSYKAKWHDDYKMMSSKSKMGQAFCKMA